MTTSECLCFVLLSCVCVCVYIYSSVFFILFFTRFFFFSSYPLPPVPPSMPFTVKPSSHSPVFFFVCTCSRVLSGVQERLTSVCPFFLYVLVCFCVCLEIMPQESLERLVRDAQMNGVRQIPRVPAVKAKATPPPPPKEEGKEDYPYRCVPILILYVRAWCVRACVR